MPNTLHNHHLHDNILQRTISMVCLTCMYLLNDSWMKLMPSIMAEKPTFFAVGALHLVGERGMLTQLQKAGYTVTPCK